MKCVICGSGFRPRGGGKPQKYCSVKCRNKAKVKARKARKNGTMPQPAEAPKPANITRRAPEAAKPETAKPAPKKAKERPDLSRDEFRRMMDESLEDVLRRNRDRLSKALDDPDTPANALAAISRQLIAVVERLDRLEGGDPLLDAGDGLDSRDLTQEADDGAGKAVV
ncbi:hypothetical protein [Pseudoscardovia suis]|uniref:Terminase small subunit n=1 Tax=Pseudoscardovia suis TaxID=987063 RepID=A0A261F112_9BIFI|nr:hypothetical protein [Pseudoscardovia suis]OZG52778.1 hypothetical protein PSSU_0396 [Pseudoscardovia suis]PJJ64953.1 hypothetical protein CLV65_1505 [Pseudoscardovia suis]